MLNSKIKKIVQRRNWGAQDETSWVPNNGLIWDSTNGEVYKRTTTHLMKSIINTSDRSRKIKYDGTMYHMGSMPRMLQGISNIMRQKIASGEIK